MRMKLTKRSKRPYKGRYAPESEKLSRLIKKISLMMPVVLSLGIAAGYFAITYHAQSDKLEQETRSFAQWLSNKPLDLSADNPAIKSQLELVMRDHDSPYPCKVFILSANGLEATRAIRGLPAPQGQVPIIALTAGVTRAEVDKYLAKGMNDTITKPIDWKRFVEVIGHWERLIRKHADGQHGLPVPGESHAQQRHS